MYIRKSSRTYNGKTYFNYVLVESVLTPKDRARKSFARLATCGLAPELSG